MATAFTARAHPEERHPPGQLFAYAASNDDQKAERALQTLAEWWRDDYACILVDIVQFIPPRQTSTMSGRRGGGRGGGGLDGTGGGRVGGGFDDESDLGGAGDGWRAGGGWGAPPEPGQASRVRPMTKIRERLVRFLEDQTGQRFGDDLGAWRRWYWNRPYAPHPDYAAIKAGIYSHVEEELGEFFMFGGGATVRLDEIDWGGRPRSRLRSLDHPKHIPAAEADFLGDGHIVFGLEVNGEARAYPERILARHPLTLDRLGARELAIVSDRVCGTVVPYASETHGNRLNFKPSGLIYRSNQLIYDEETMSLWSTIDGRPVRGPLTLHDVEIQAYPIVATRWREWKALHPDTTVLSTDTGYDLDYSREGRFSRVLRSDWLLFDVPVLDDRLKTKETVLGLVLRAAEGADAGTRRALAIKSKFLEKKQNRIHQRSFAGREIVIVTSRDGAHRVYEAGETRFVAQEKDGRLRDATGDYWRLSEAALVPEAAGRTPKGRLAARRVFWFAWQAQFPDTELVR